MQSLFDLSTLWPLLCPLSPPPVYAQSLPSNLMPGQATASHLIGVRQWLYRSPPVGSGSVYSSPFVSFYSLKSAYEPFSNLLRVKPYSWPRQDRVCVREWRFQQVRRWPSCHPTLFMREERWWLAVPFHYDWLWIPRGLCSRPSAYLSMHKYLDQNPPT